MEAFMRSPEITAAVSAFEVAAKPECPAYGWDAWPLLRCILAFAEDSGERARLTQLPAVLSAAPMGVRTIPKTPGWAIRTRGTGFVGVPTQQVAIITHANRSQLLGDKYYRYMADPVAQMLTSAGVTAAVWQMGPPAWPHWHRAFFCEGPVLAGAAARQLSGRARHLWNAPPWFAEIADWHREAFGSPLFWPSVSRLLCSIEAMRQTYASWFKRAGTRLVLVDCWYGAPGMAAILGARSAGIPALDLQHGTQGVGNYAYSGWHGSDYTTRMSPFPSGFWVWGSRDGDALVRHNAGVLDHDRVFAVGYPWLTAWLPPSDRALLESDAAAARLTQRADKVILVTLQVREQIQEALELASHGPANWLWLLRIHRKWRKASAAVEREALDRGLTQVVSVQATYLPLYALMRHSDVHVTWASTCAIEAAAFGVPTVLLDHAAEAIYSDHISAGIMRLALEKDSANGQIADALSFAFGDSPTTSSTFASPDTAQPELRRLLSTYGL